MQCWNFFHSCSSWCTCWVQEKFQRIWGTATFCLHCLYFCSVSADIFCKHGRSIRVLASQNLFRVLVIIRMDFWGDAKPIFRGKLRNFSNPFLVFLSTSHTSMGEISHQERQGYKRNKQEITWNTKKILWEYVMLCYVSCNWSQISNTSSLDANTAALLLGP